MYVSRLTYWYFFFTCRTCIFRDCIWICSSMWRLNWWKYLKADSNNVYKGHYSIHRWYAKKTGYPKPSTILPIIHIVDDENDDNDKYMSMMNMNNETMSIMIHNRTNRDVLYFLNPFGHVWGTIEKKNSGFCRSLMAWSTCTASWPRNGEMCGICAVANEKLP